VRDYYIFFILGLVTLILFFLIIFPFIGKNPFEINKVTLGVVKYVDYEDTEYELPLLRFHYKDNTVAECNIIMLFVEVICFVIIIYSFRRNNPYENYNNKL
jgi:hypothetical protein